jgi:hypothetical protein
MKPAFSRYGIKKSNIKFYQNPSRESPVSVGLTDGPTDLTLIAAFCNFAKAPENGEEDNDGETYLCCGHVYFDKLNFGRNSRLVWLDAANMTPRDIEHVAACRGCRNC